MALSAFCTSCQRTVYLDEGHTAICPVCSSPLVHTQDDEPTGDPEESESEGTADKEAV